MRLRHTTRGVFLVLIVLGSLPMLARAQCAQWDVSGEWALVQRGLKYDILLTMQQNDRVLAGKARISTNPGYPAVPVHGTIDTDRVNFQIFWIDGSIGVYDGNFLPAGRLDGLGYEKKTFNIRHKWESKKKFKCVRMSVKSTRSDILDRSAKKPPLYTGPTKFDPPPTPGASVPVSGSSTSTPPPMKVPGIIAHPVRYPFTGALTGTAVLVWDAGPDHKYAEVWVKVNAGDETFLVELGKGSREVTVERGKYYTYILTDNGVTLATVTVIGN